MTYVIVGAGPSGVVAAETLAKQGAGGNIILIGGEPEPPYSRMAIPYVLTGKIDYPGTYLRKDDGHYDDLGIEYRQGFVESVDAKAKTLTLAGGDKVSYDKLLIATGATPVKPPIDGLDNEGVAHCWTLEDTRKIVERAAEGSDVVLMGAGFIGCIILEALVSRGVNLTVIEAEDRMVPRMMDEVGGNMIKRWCEDKGVTVLTSTRATGIEKKDGRLSVGIDRGDGKGGDALAADLVVVATGVKSNIDFLDGTGVKTKTGIIVDDHLRSSVEDIFAAGDCAEGPDFSGGWAVHAIQPTATEHGRIAAVNMMGGTATYKGSLTMNVLDTLGLISASFGDWQGGDSHAEIVDQDNFRYMNLAFEGDKLVGALSLGRTDHIGVVRGLIQTRVDLGKWKDVLKNDPNRVAEAYVGQTH